MRLLQEVLLVDLDRPKDARHPAPANAFPGCRFPVPIELAETGGDLLRDELKDEQLGALGEAEDDRERLALKDRPLL